MSIADIYRKIAEREKQPPDDSMDVKKYLAPLHNMERRETARKRGRAHSQVKEIVDDGTEQQQLVERSTGETGGVGGGGTGATEGADTGADELHQSPGHETEQTDSETSEQSEPTVPAADFGDKASRERRSNRRTR